MPRLSLDRGPLLPTLLLGPAAVLLGGLLAFPLALGVLLGFKDASIGEPGAFIGLENYRYLLTDPVFRITALNTGLYTLVTVVFKLALGLALALILNQRFAGYRFWRSVLLLPYVVPTVLSAFAWWWILDPQLSWTITRGGPANATHLFVTLAYQRAIPGGALGEGAAIAGFTLPLLAVLAWGALDALRRQE